MSALDVSRPRRVISRCARVLLIVLAIISIAASINIMGIAVFGDVNGWSKWLDSHRGYFLVWRLALYVATAYGWWWMRRRVLHREGTIETHRRLRRAEIAAVLAILALEVSVLTQSG